ncbi:hypothetical protein TNIN_151151 [Trichonephila inaurata madagascariensis]|uniref:Uncharacterized protein n=1 Tax=Trichonephila inaurata madagascariensis TaxID=2747483 RepID=A0A8X6JX30_9ARAC|nr:hypothetical protein TNIN_151151 [Trichonephila inaurata madagascariensis]
MPFTFFTRKCVLEQANNKLNILCFRKVTLSTFDSKGNARRPANRRRKAPIPLRGPEDCFRSTENGICINLAPNTSRGDPVACFGGAFGIIKSFSQSFFESLSYTGVPPEF